MACAADEVSDYFGRSCVKCPAGDMCPDKLLKNSKECPMGTYSTQGMMDCKACPAGKSCVDTKVTPVQCAANTFSEIGQS